MNTLALVSKGESGGKRLYIVAIGIVKSVMFNVEYIMYYFASLVPRLSRLRSVGESLVHFITCVTSRVDAR